MDVKDNEYEVGLEELPARASASLANLSSILELCRSLEPTGDDEDEMIQCV